MPRAQSGGSLLLNSSWILFVLYLAPAIGLALLVGFIVLLAYHSGALSEGLGFALSRKRAMPRKRKRLVDYFVAGAAWLIAIEYLLTRGRGGASPQQAFNNATTIPNDVLGKQPGSNPLLAGVSQFSSLFQTDWFYIAFLGLLVVCSVIVGRGVILSWQETRSELRRQTETTRTEAISSIEDAFRILTAKLEEDPRIRIINCYQRMVLAAQRQGATITSDLTARELEAAIHNMLGIKGPSMRDLTNLFEEARYSLHLITEDNAAEAQQYLLNIAQEMNFTISI